MKIAKLSISRPVTFFMIYLIAIGAGFFGLSNLKLALYPDMEFPMAIVMTTYDGVGPEDIENTITRSIESAVVSVDGVKHVTSSSSKGMSLVQIEFNWGSDMDQAESDVRSKLDVFSDYIPDDASDPMVFVFDPSMMPVMRMSISADDMGEAELRRLVEDRIQPRLERIDGVASASVSGGLEREVQVNVNPYQLAANNISIQEIISFLAMANLPIPGGLIEEGNKEFSVVSNSEFSSVSDIENTVVGYSPYGSPIYLKNVAKVEDSYKELDNVVRDNGKNTINMRIQKQSDANTVQICSETLDELENIKTSIGKNIDFKVAFDQSEFIKQSAGNLTSTAILAFILAGFVLFVFLRHLKSSLIASISIPVSIIVTFVVMYAMDITLNIISMAGLAIAIGMLVDNAVVVLENIFRRNHELDEPICQAAENGTNEVGAAVVASTLTTLSIFIPMLFVGGIAGMMIKDLALTIVVSLTVSLIVSLTLIPLLASKFLSKKQQSHKTKLMGGFDRGMSKFFENMGAAYRRSLTWSLGHKKTLIAVIVVLFVISLNMLGRVGFEFMPKTDDNEVNFSIELPVGTALPLTDKYFQQIEKVISEEVPELDNLNISFGRADGFAAIFGGSSNTGSASISLIDKEERDRSKFEIQDILRDEINAIPGVKAEFSSGGMQGNQSDVVVELYSHDIVKGEEIATQIGAMMENIPGMVDVDLSFSDPQPEYQIVIDREKIASMGLNIAQIAQIIETSVKGKIASLYRENGEEYNVYVQLDREFRQSRIDLESIFIKSSSGAQIPLSAIASIEDGESMVTITRQDQSRMLSISANVTGRNLGEVTQDLETELASLSLPADFRYNISGAAEDMQETAGSFILAILVAILLVYMVMASQFESLLDPFIILFTIPLALIGVAIALFITGTTLNMTSLIGCMVLVGIVVNNGIVLIDYINKVIESKKSSSITDAILTGAQTRLRPVLMTALTTILSMLPLAFELGSGSELWGPMARTIIGGLVASTFLTLFFVPVMFDIFQHKRMEKRIKSC